MAFELDGEPPRVIKAGQAFWEPGGHVIHYQDASNRTDIHLRFVLTMMMARGQPMLASNAANTVDRGPSNEAVERPPLKDLLHRGQPSGDAGRHAADAASAACVVLLEPQLALPAWPP